MENLSTNSVLVIGDDTRIFLSVARSLGRTGKRVVAYPTDPNAAAMSSRYVSEIVPSVAYEVDPLAWRDGLRRLLVERQFDLVIPCTDAGVIALHEDAWGCSSRVAIPSTEAIRTLFDKTNTHELCDELGIPAAKWSPLEEADDENSLVHRFGLPLVIKPRRSFSGDTGRSREIVEIIEDRQDLVRVLAMIEDRNRYLVESFFEGAGTGVSLLALDGEVLQAFQHRRLREGRGGCSSYRVSEALNEDLLQAAKAVCAKLKHTGVCMFEFRVNHSTGQWILVEVNARFWGSMPLPLALGIDFPSQLYDLIVNGARHLPTSYRTGVRSRNLLLDANNLIKELKRVRTSGFGALTMSLADFVAQPIRWLLGAEKVDCFSLDDMAPGLKEISQALLSVFHRKHKQTCSRGAISGMDAAPDSMLGLLK